MTGVISYLETQRHQEAIEEEKAIPIIEVLDYAIKPDKRFAPKRGTILIVSTFVTTIVVLTLFFLLSFRDLRKEMTIE